MVVLEKDDIYINHSTAIINKDKLIGKIDYVNVILDDQCNMSEAEFKKNPLFIS